MSPDKAIDLIDEAAAQLKIESNNKPQIILQQENKLHTIDEKLNNLQGENIEAQEKLLIYETTIRGKIERFL